MRYMQTVWLSFPDMDLDLKQFSEVIFREIFF